MTVSSSERRLAASANAHMSWAATPDRSARTANARAALEASFVEQAGGDALRAESLRKAYFANLARRSVAARRKAAEASAEAQAVAAELDVIGNVPDETAETL